MVHLTIMTTDRWDPTGCNFETAGAGLLNAARWFGRKPPALPSEAELEERLAPRLKDHPRIDILLSHKGGMGDSLLCSTVAYELKRRGVGSVWLETRWPDDFQRQRPFDGVLPESYESEKLVERLGGRVLYPFYAQGAPGEDRETGPAGHVLEAMCRHAGIRGEIALRPYFAPGERYRYVPLDFIAISGVGGHAVSTKDWFHDRFQQVAGRLRAKYPDRRLVQLGAVTDRLIAGAMDLRGQTTIRQAASILKQAKCYVGEHGGLMHLARAVDCPSAVVFGGRETAAQSGYSANANVVKEVSCSPCWLIRNCPHRMECMDLIQPDDVIAAVEAVLSRAGRPLPVDRAVIA